MLLPWQIVTYRNANPFHNLCHLWLKFLSLSCPEGFSYTRFPLVASLALERDRAHRTDPGADLGGIGLVHVEEVGHDRPDYCLAPVVRSHSDNATEDLNRPTVPILGHVVKSGEAGIDEDSQIFADDFAPIPLRNAKPARGILHQAVKTLAKGFVVDLFPKGQQPFRRCHLREG
jgi:hypothetical protein